MLFSELSKYFQKLEQTPSRNEMTVILSDLFKKASSSEIGEICYLLQGRVAPLYEAIEFGIADKLMMRAIASAYSKEEADVLKRFKKSGDLGVTAEEISNENQHTKNTSSIHDVFETLTELAHLGGVGSQEKKIQLLSTLFSTSDSLSVRYLARIPLNKLRLGFSDMTILDGLSWMLTSDKSNRKRLELAHDVRPDLGYIATQVKEQGIRGVSHIRAKVGAPILAALCQRLPDAEEMIAKMGEVDVEPKFDGVRCIGGYTGLFVQGKGFISARNIRMGDEVLTHTGSFQKVLAVHKRLPRKRERFYKLQTMLGEEFIISSEHPLLVKNGNSVQWKKAQFVTPQDWVVFPRISIPPKKPQTDLSLIDDAGYQKTIKCNTEFYRFLGFWIGDGFSNNSHQSERIGLTFNAVTEKKLALIYEQIIHQRFGINKVSKYTHNGGLNIYWRDSVFRRWLVKEFRYVLKNGSHGKSIPSWIFNISKKHFSAFLQGWTSRHSGGNRITTKERQLASMAVLLGFSFDTPIGVRKVRSRATQNGKFHTYYELYLPGTQRYVVQNNDYFLIKMHTTKKHALDSRIYLYDFQIDRDESYCTSLASLHNCQIHYQKRKPTSSYSRNLENTTAMYPELTHIASQIHADEVILDSEAVGYDEKTNRIIPFQETVTRKRKHDITLFSKNVPLRFFVFDILTKNGEDLMNVPLSQRRAILEKTIINGPILSLSPHIVTKDIQALRNYHTEQIKHGLEGVVVKKWDGMYEPGRRGFTWVKFKEEGKIGKLADTVDCVVMGYYKGEGKRTSFGIGALLVGVKKGSDFVTITKIGTGVSDELWKEIKKVLSLQSTVHKPKEYEEIEKVLEPDVWINPSMVVEIAADDITKSPIHGAKFALRFPRLVRIRTDKSIDQITTTKELEDMYHNQESIV